MLRGVLLVTLLTSVAFAGCSGDADPCKGTPDCPGGPPGPDESGSMTILGLVQNETFVPVGGAQVSLRMTDRVATTDAAGQFSFRGVPLAPYLVDVAAAGFANATLNAEPMANVSLSFILHPPPTAIPPPVTVQFTGYFDCAFEALIIPGSCDLFLDPVLNATGQDLFKDRNRFETGLGDRWSTAVVDVVFDPQAGLDGLHLTLRGRDDSDQLGAYQQYGQFQGKDDFSFRIEPGQTYAGGTQPMTTNATALQIDVYPMGYGYHALCTPPAPDVLGPGQCPLGVGAALNVQFTLYVTVFFIEPAPEGFSLLA